MSKLKGLLLAFLLCFSIVAGPFTAAVIATHGDTSGTVTASADGTAIAGATVYAYDGTGTEVTNTTTATDGGYAFHLADGDYTIRVVADGYTVREKAVSVVGATVVDFALDSSKELYNKTLAVTDDDDDVYAEIQNSTDMVSFEFYGVDSTGTETLVDSIHLSAGPSEFVEHRVPVDNVTYDSYRVVASGTAVETLDVGLVGKMSGGGGALMTNGGFFNWTLFGIPVIVVVGGAALAYGLRDEL